MHIFWKDKIDYNKIIMFTQNNLIMVNGSVKQHKAQIIPRDFSNHTEYPPNTRMDSVWATKEWARAQLGNL